MNTQTRATFFAFLAAVLYAVNSPLSKLLLDHTMMAAFLYLGAGLSLAVFRELPSVSYLAALVIMIAGTYFASSDGKEG